MLFFFFKQKTAYEMRISDWSSDVCSSDLIALGGWTSANYAALACANDFPKCVGQWWPPHDFREGFVLWRGIGVDYEGGILDGASRIAIQMAHRMMAVVAFAEIGRASCRERVCKYV